MLDYRRYRRFVWGQIALYRDAWSARMASGHYGPITADEEGVTYGTAQIIGGKMTLPPTDDQHQ